MDIRIRNILNIDEERCNGCGLCVPVCSDKALAVKDGKARLLSESLCDGLGACLSSCPEGALSLIRKVTVPYAGAASQSAAEPVPSLVSPVLSAPAQAPAPDAASQGPARAPSPNAPCRHWPLKLSLCETESDLMRGARLLIAGDCTAFACRDLHLSQAKGKVILIGCPKLEDPKVLLEKTMALFRQANPESCTVVRMEKPCCKGLHTICTQAAKAVRQDLSVDDVVIYCDGLMQDTP